MGNETSAPIQYGTKLLNDINFAWKKVEMDAKLPSRDGHCAAAMANKLYVFGGVRWLSDIGEAAESNEILVFDTGKHLRHLSFNHVRNDLGIATYYRTGDETAFV